MISPEEDLITMAELSRRTGKPEEFLNKLPLPRYPVGKRDFVRECDYIPAIEALRKEPKQWQNGGRRSLQTSNGSRGRRTSGTNSGCKVIGFEEALKQTM